jgi:Domain of unknown function (DUF4440)
MSTDTAARGDLDALLVLNHDYIHSVQHGDVRRFDEILAEDFLCSNPDASLVDKSEFLAQIERPVTISGLTAQDVQVRILGDVAIIHARTSYTTADGKARVAAIPMCGRAEPVNGSRYQPMSRARRKPHAARRPIG